MRSQIIEVKYIYSLENRETEWITEGQKDRCSYPKSISERFLLITDFAWLPFSYWILGQQKFLQGQRPSLTFLSKAVTMSLAQAHIHEEIQPQSKDQKARIPALFCKLSSYL